MTEENNEKVEGAAQAAPEEQPEIIEEAPDQEESDVVAEAEAVLEDSMEAQLAQAKADAEEALGKYMRLHAEWDTYRRRMEEQRKDERARACEGLVSDLLPVLDDFERSIDFAQNNGETGLLDGIKQVYSKMVGVLEKGGVVVINPAGEAFDALEHQAVANVDRTDVYDETVEQVYQKGYKMGRKVIRPAMVTVATGGPKRPVEEPEEESAE